MRVAIVQLINDSAPARPACFESDELWRSWLQSAHESGTRIVRRVDENQRTPNRRTHYAMLPTKEIDYCASCTAGFQKRMQAVGKCQPCNALIEQEPADAT